MFGIHRQKRNFIVYDIDAEAQVVKVEDLLSGLRIEIPFGEKRLERAEFCDQYELRFYYKDGSEKVVNLLMQGY